MTLLEVLMCIAVALLLYIALGVGTILKGSTPPPKRPQQSNEESEITK